MLKWQQQKLTQSALVKELATATGVSTKVAKHLTTVFVDIILKEVKKNGVWAIVPGIGKLVRVERKARMGQQPERPARRSRFPAKKVSEVPHRQGRKRRDRSAEEEIGSSRLLLARAPQSIFCFAASGSRFERRGTGFQQYFPPADSSAYGRKFVSAAFFFAGGGCRKAHPAGSRAASTGGIEQNGGVLRLR